MPHIDASLKPRFVEPFETALSSECEIMNTDSEFESKLTGPQTFCRAELNDLVRDLGLSKKQVRIVILKLKKQKNLLGMYNANILSTEGVPRLTPKVYQLPHPDMFKIPGTYGRAFAGQSLS